MLPSLLAKTSTLVRFLLGTWTYLGGIHSHKAGGLDRVTIMLLGGDPQAGLAPDVL